MPETTDRNDPRLSHGVDAEPVPQAAEFTWDDGQRVGS